MAFWKLMVRKRISSRVKCSKATAKLNNVAPASRVHVYLNDGHEWKSQMCQYTNWFAGYIDESKMHDLTYCCSMWMPRNLSSVEMSPQLEHLNRQGCSTGALCSSTRPSAPSSFPPGRRIVSTTITQGPYFNSL